MTSPTPNNINCTHTDGKLNGTKIVVADGDIADFVIVSAKDSSDIGLYILNLKESNTLIETQHTLDPSRSHASITFSQSNCESLGDPKEGWINIENILNRAAVLFAFEQLGGAEACMNMAKEYSLERFAFGRPIGSFQAIKYKLADMYVAITLAKSNSYYAAWALSSESTDLATASATARVSATKAYQLCSKENIQTHGGNGYTWEYDCHLYYKRSKLLSVNIGSLTNWKEKLVSSLEQSNTN